MPGGLTQRHAQTSRDVCLATPCIIFKRGMPPLIGGGASNHARQASDEASPLQK